uniref:Uncharacterized protein n=1 Tax=Burkholderia phage vB_BgluM-SURPRISE13 TaxID=3159457 RepID=A0AAU7PFD0_9VIRU
MNNTLYQVTVLEFCLYLSEKFMEGKKFEQVDWDEITFRVERQNLSAGEEKRVLEYVATQRMAMREAEHAERAAAVAIERAQKGVVLSAGLMLKAMA